MGFKPSDIQVNLRRIINFETVCESSFVKGALWDATSASHIAVVEVLDKTSRVAKGELQDTCISWRRTPLLRQPRGIAVAASHLEGYPRHPTAYYVPYLLVTFENSRHI